MLFDKDEILTSLVVKANEKIEQLRHEMAQDMFEATLSEEAYFVYNKQSEDIVAGPFATRAKARVFRDKEANSFQLDVASDKELQSKLG